MILHGAVEIALPILALAVLCVAHLVLLRHFPKMPPGAAWGRAAAATGVVLLMGELAMALSAPTSWSHLWRHGSANVVAYLCFAYAYFHAFNLSETGRRIRILLELKASDPLSEEAILARYSAREVLDRRLERLRRSGQAEIRGDRVIATGRSVFAMAMIVAALKWLLAGQTDAAMNAPAPRNGEFHGDCRR